MNDPHGPRAAKPGAKIPPPPPPTTVREILRARDRNAETAGFMRAALHHYPGRMAAGIRVGFEGGPGATRACVAAGRHPFSPAIGIVEHPDGHLERIPGEVKPGGTVYFNPDDADE